MPSLVRRLTSSHDMTFGQSLANYAQKSEACAQNCRCRCLVMLREWFLDTSIGLPYVDASNVRPADIPILVAAIKSTIVNTVDVDQLVSFTWTLDKNTRKFIASAMITTIYGDTLNIQVP